MFTDTKLQVREVLVALLRMFWRSRRLDMIRGSTDTGVIFTGYEG